MADRRKMAVLATGTTNREFVGIDHVMWSSDYPYQASCWPHSQDVVAGDFKNATSVFAITRGNVARLYEFED